MSTDLFPHPPRLVSGMSEAIFNTGVLMALAFLVGWAIHLVVLDYAPGTTVSVSIALAVALTVAYGTQMSAAVTVAALVSTAALLLHMQVVANRTLSKAALRDVMA